jgi:hypothetical protein
MKKLLLLITLAFGLQPSAFSGTNASITLNTNTGQLSNLGFSSGGLGLIWSNSITGAWGQIPTNSHVHLTDEHGTTYDFHTNGALAIVQTNGVSTIISNGSIATSSNVTAVGIAASGLVPGEGIAGAFTQVNTQGLQSGYGASMVRIGYQTGQYPITGLRTWWDNWYYNSTPPWTANSYYHTNAVSLEYPAGTFYRLTFGGATNITMQPGQVPTPSDPLFGVTIPANAVFWIRCYRTGTNWPYGYIPDCLPGNSAGGQVGGFWNGAYGTVQDLTLTGTVTNAFGYAFGPTCITALRADGSKVPPCSLTVAGDSIFVGVNAGYAFNYQNTFLNVGLSNTISFANFAGAAQDLEREYTTAIFSNLWPLIGNALLHETKVNSIRSGGDNDSFSTVTNLLIEEHNYWNACGLKVIETTCTPVSTSSDNFETLANQTTDANNAVRVQVNDWIRTNGWPFIDLASMVESSLDSGKWVVSGAANFMTTDGLHPNASGNNYIMTNGQWTAALAQVFQLQNGRQNYGGPFIGPLVGAVTTPSTVPGAGPVYYEDYLGDVTMNGQMSMLGQLNVAGKAMLGGNVWDTNLLFVEGSEYVIGALSANNLIISNTATIDSTAFGVGLTNTTSAGFNGNGGGLTNMPAYPIYSYFWQAQGGAITYGTTLYSLLGFQNSTANYIESPTTFPSTAYISSVAFTIGFTANLGTGTNVQWLLYTNGVEYGALASITGTGSWSYTNYQSAALNISMAGVTNMYVGLYENDSSSATPQMGCAGVMYITPR